MRTNGLLLIGDDDAVLMSDWNSWRMYSEERAKQYGTRPRSFLDRPGVGKGGCMFFQTNVFGWAVNEVRTSGACACIVSDMHVDLGLLQL